MSGEIRKAIVLENGFKQDIPDELIEYLEDEGIKWKWYDTRFSFWKENRAKTIKFFSDLPVAQMLVCHTVFDGYQQLELFINLLHSLREKNFTFKIMHGCLAEDLYKWYDKYESSLTPDTPEYNDDPEKRAIFKREMNKKFREVLAAHKIVWVRGHGMEEHLTDLSMIKKLAK
jgi:hypothetical protein